MHLPILRCQQVSLQLPVKTCTCRTGAQLWHCINLGPSFLEWVPNCISWSPQVCILSACAQDTHIYVSVYPFSRPVQYCFSMCVHCTCKSFFGSLPIKWHCPATNTWYHIYVGHMQCNDNEDMLKSDTILLHIIRYYCEINRFLDIRDMTLYFF